MHLPCPKCGTVYDVDLKLYTPGTSFQCVNCHDIVVVPTETAPSASEPDPMPFLPEAEESPTMEFGNEEVDEDAIATSAPETDGGFDIQLDELDQDNLSTTEFGSLNEPEVSPTIDFGTLQGEDPAQFTLEEPAPGGPSLDGTSQVADIDPLDPSFLDDLVPSPFDEIQEPASQDTNTPDFGQPLNLDDGLDLDSQALDLTSDLHAANLLDDRADAAPALGDDVIPSLMDELSIEEPIASDSILDTASAADFAMSGDEGIDAGGFDIQFDDFSEPLEADAGFGIAGTRPADPAPRSAASHVDVSPSYEKTHEKASRTPLLLFGILLVAVVGVAATFVDFSLLLQPEPEVPPKSAAQIAQEKKIAAKLAKRKAEEEARQKAEAAFRPLSRDSVNQLTYEELGAGLNKTAGQQDVGLRAWALYRMASTFTAPTAKSELTGMELPTDASDPLALAAHGGSLLLQQKTEAARKMLEPLWRSQPKAAPEAGLVLAQLYDLRDMTKKAEIVVNKIKTSGLKGLDVKLITARIAYHLQRPVKAHQLLTASPKEDIGVTEALVRGLELERGGSFSQLCDNIEALKLSHSLKLPPDSELSAFGQRARRYQNILSGRFDLGLTEAKLTLTNDPKDLGALIAVARWQDASGEDGTATLAAELEQRKDPALQARIVREQVRLTLFDGDIERAKGLLEPVSALAPKKTGGWIALARGEIARASGNIKQARSFFSTALDIAPKLLQAQVALGEVSGARSSEQLANLSKLSRAHSDGVVKLALARAMASRANLQGAIDLLQQVLWSEPTAGDPQSLTLELIQYLADAKQFDRSLKLAKLLYEASAKGPSRLPVAKMAAAIAETSTLPDQRAFWFGELDRLEPFVHETVISRVRALLDLNRNIEARVAIETFLKEKPDWRTAELVKQLARTWINDDDVKARQFIKDSLRIQKQAESFILLGQLEEQRQNRMNAIDAYRDALEIDAQRTQIRRKLAELLLKSGDLDDASAQLKVITTQEPTDTTSREKLADIYRDLGRPRLALEEYLAIMRYSKASEEVLMKAARLQLYDLGKLAAASRTLKRILQINPKNAEARYRLGVALKDQEQIEAAKAQFKRYLELAPQGEFAQEVQGELLNLNAR